MPTPSSHYSDLEYATVNQDGDTWGGITNNYINGLLTKLRDLEDRVIVAEGQLTTINASVDPVNKMNTTLASALQGKAVLSGTTTTLSPDPYSGNYSTATTWPAYGSAELASISVPTSLSEVQNFSYENFANALSPILTAIEAKVTQATADVSAARIDICKTKKLLDAFNAGGTVTKTLGGSPSYSWTNPDNGSNGSSFVAQASYLVAQTSVGNPDFSYSNGLLTVAFSLLSDPHNPYGTGNHSTNLQAHNRLVSNGYLTSGSFVNVHANFVGDFISSFATNSTIILIGHYSFGGTNPFFTNGSVGTVSMQIQNATLQIKWLSGGLVMKAQYVPTMNATQAQVNNVSAASLAPVINGSGHITIGLSQHTISEQINFTTPDVSSCDTNPGGPHFIT